MAEGDRERWNEKWSVGGVGTGHGSGIVELIGDRLPVVGRALDIGGGGSADSLELARRGLAVTVVDVSDIGLSTARDRADAEALTIATVAADLDTDPIPSGPWDVVVISNYLQRRVLGAVGEQLAPGGLLAVIIATVANLDRHQRPSRRFLLEPGELPDLVGDLEIVHQSEAWRLNDRHEAHLVARAGPRDEGAIAGVGRPVRNDG